MILGWRPLYDKPTSLRGYNKGILTMPIDSSRSNSISMPNAASANTDSTVSNTIEQRVSNKLSTKTAQVASLVKLTQAEDMRAALANPITRWLLLDPKQDSESEMVNRVRAMHSVVNTVARKGAQPNMNINMNVPARQAPTPIQSEDDIQYNAAQSNALQQDQELNLTPPSQLGQWLLNQDQVSELSNAVFRR